MRFMIPWRPLLAICVVAIPVDQGEFRIARQGNLTADIP